MLVGESTPEIDPIVSDILTKLNGITEFQKVSDEIRSKNIKISYKILANEDCVRMNINSAMVDFHNSFLFGPETKVLIKESLPEDKKMRSIIAETCNSLLRSEFMALDSLAIAGSIKEEKYVIGKEKIEWKAYRRAVLISKAVDDAGIFPDQPLYTDKEQLAAESFEKYYKMSEKYFHVDKYKQNWRAIAPAPISR
jgi:hypothetical protein